MMDTDISGEHKFAQDSGMTFQEVYNFAFRWLFAPLMQRLGQELGGEDRFIEMLKRASCDVVSEGAQNSAKSAPSNDLAAFTAALRDLNHFRKHVLTFDVVEDTDTAFQIQVTECLWAKTFHEAGAADIGYATICHPDFAACQAFNPKIKMIRDKTLMQGDDCCNHRWIWEE
jgi:hypothetical protein